ncbi:MAG: hypothetical protein AAFZ91_01205 [Pseudomonadota bacterium]
MESRPSIGFHRWKLLNKAPWSGAWDFGRWGGLIVALFVFATLGIPVLVAIGYVFLALISATFYVFRDPFEYGFGGFLSLFVGWALFFSPVIYFFVDKQDDFGAGEPLSPKKREAWRKRKARETDP